MYNLMRGTATEWAQILVAFCDELAPPPPEVLAICHQVILVRRHGSHYRKESQRPDTVEEFDSQTFRVCVKQTVHQWKHAPVAVQLEFTQMAQYASACVPARTILVEHDITFDLQEQLLEADSSNWELRQQLEKWRTFETAAWREVECVVTMSEKDAATRDRRAASRVPAERSRYRAISAGAKTNRIRAGCSLSGHSRICQTFWRSNFSCAISGRSLAPDTRCTSSRDYGPSTSSTFTAAVSNSI